MHRPRIAIVSFPGNNGEVESMRVIRRVGMEPVYFRWNGDRAELKDIDGYFIPGGFSYEDRGRSGMVAARDPLMEFIAAEADAGKVVVGICNGAQVLVESGLIPNGAGLQMSLAKNAVETGKGMQGLPLLSEWVWITRSCKKGRCATGYWDGVLQIPIAHGEGRFTTRDADLMDELRKNDQVAFSYCDAAGTVSTDPEITPNGSMFAIAGVCNPRGNVIALMPHPERAPGVGDVYFASMKEWIEKGQTAKGAERKHTSQDRVDLPPHSPDNNVEIFVETIITNNEERTVEQAARRVAPTLTLKQWKYLSVPEPAVMAVLSDLTVFNSNKERAFLRRGKALVRWDAQRKSEVEVSGSSLKKFTSGHLLLRRDIPDTGAAAFGKGSMTGIAYGIEKISDQELCSKNLLEVFANPHASTLERLSW